MISQNDVINCTNKALVAYFIKHGDIKPINIFLGRNDTLVFQYRMADTQLLYEEWLKEKNN